MHCRAARQLHNRLRGGVAAAGTAGPQQLRYRCSPRRSAAGVIAAAVVAAAVDGRKIASHSLSEPLCMNAGFQLTTAGCLLMVCWPSAPTGYKACLVSASGHTDGTLRAYLQETSQLWCCQLVLLFLHGIVHAAHSCYQQYWCYALPDLVIVGRRAASIALASECASIRVQKFAPVLRLVCSCTWRHVTCGCDRIVLFGLR